ncbi:MAG: hypothetical protein ACPLIG_06990 [Candidatus Bathyarchaeales archaeon]
MPRNSILVNYSIASALVIGFPQGQTDRVSIQVDLVQGFSYRMLLAF